MMNVLKQYLFSSVQKVLAIVMEYFLYWAAILFLLLQCQEGKYIIIAWPCIVQGKFMNHVP